MGTEKQSGAGEQADTGDGGTDNGVDVCDWCGVSNLPNTTWTYTLDMSAQSVNQVGSNAPGRNGFAYRRYRARLERDLRNWDAPKASGHRFLTACRVYGPRKRAYDTSNFAQGCKPLVDVLVKLGLLRGDTQALLTDRYLQMAGPSDKLIIEIGEYRE